MICCEEVLGLIMTMIEYKNKYYLVYNVFI